MPSDTPQPAFVLVNPQMGENIGSAARAMWNFSLDRMRLVAPRDGWPNAKADALAAGAGRLLDEAQLFATTAEALEDCSFVFATTARARDLTKPVYSPESAMALAAQKIAKGEKVAVLFGPERAGLENEDIALANAAINVPVNPDFSSLNLAQCVLLTGYEWQRQVGDVTHERTDMAGTQWASHGETEALARRYEDTLQDSGFFFPPEKVTSMKLNLRNMWSRMPLTRADVQMLHGVLRQLMRWKDNQTK